MGGCSENSKWGSLHSRRPPSSASISTLLDTYLLGAGAPRATPSRCASFSQTCRLAATAPSTYRHTCTLALHLSSNADSTVACNLAQEPARPATAPIWLFTLTFNIMLSPHVPTSVGIPSRLCGKGRCYLSADISRTKSFPNHSPSIASCLAACNTHYDEQLVSV